jgi:hypothetical protein
MGCGACLVCRGSWARASRARRARHGTALARACGMFTLILYVPVHGISPVDRRTVSEAPYHAEEARRVARKQALTHQPEDCRRRR